MSENESFTLTDLIVYPYIALVVLVAILFGFSHFTKKLRKYVKFYICFDSERVMDDGVPFKAFLYMDGCKAEIRRFALDKAVCGKIKPLVGKLREVFPKLKAKNFSVSWKDEDDDEILMSSNEEVETMYHQSHEAVLKLIVRCLGPKTDDEIPETTDVMDNPARTDLVSHQGITCDGCNCPVVGFRYKCITCDDFDLCAQCENNGMHPEHCVVRVPMPNLSLPLIKATIKKSRRFLKSVASQAHEENKRLRRERGLYKLATNGGATNPGKQAPQRGASRNWVSIFGTYLEEFANLAGDISRHAQEKLAPEATKPAEPAANESSNVPSSADISLNPWNLPHEDLEKLHHACKFMRENALSATMKPLTKAFNKVLEIATTAAEEATAQSPARASSPIREGPLGRSAPQAADIDPVPQALQDALMVAKQAVEDCVRLPSAPVAPKVAQEIAEEPKASTSEQVTSESGDILPVDENGIPDLRGFCDDMAELMSAVKAAKAELSSCSSGRCSDKSDGWTLINDHYDEVKDLIINSDDSAEHEIEVAVRTEQPREFPTIYPPLNAATAVLDPNEADNAPAASAPPMPKVDDKPTTKQSPQTKPVPITKPAAKAKPTPVNPAAAHSAGTPYVLRSQLAPHVEAAVRQMESMGFSNQSGWLTQLLYHNDGNISTVLDLLTPSATHAK